MTDCKYRTPCGICTIRTDADPTPIIHYCKYEEKCEDIPFTSQSCSSCGHSVWGYENGKIVCCVCGHTMADMRKEAENEDSN